MKLMSNIPEHIIQWNLEDKCYDKKDFEGVVRLREAFCEKYPEDFDAALRLADAYVDNVKYDKALSLLTELHEVEPDALDVANVIVTCLLALGRDIKTYPWIQKPLVFYVDEVMANWCYEEVKRFGRALDSIDLFIRLEDAGCTRFFESEMLEYLSGDERFVINKDYMENYIEWVDIIEE